MKFDIASFTNRGTQRRVNQDHILINGHLLNDGELILRNESICNCFVADGVGGNKAGEYASGFVLERINAQKEFMISKYEESLRKINKDLIAASGSNPDLAGTATTLSGLVISNSGFSLLQVGDSQIWLLRNNMFFKITEDQVFSEFETNSPLISYFGGFEDHLDVNSESNIHSCISDDLFLICSDGLFKSLDQMTVKDILCNEKDLSSKSAEILKMTGVKGAPDNVSIILIRAKED